jgi:hypothetical protein
MNAMALECGTPGTPSAVLATLLYANVRRKSRGPGPQNAHSARYRIAAETRSVVECTNCVSSRVMRDVSRDVSPYLACSEERER